MENLSVRTKILLLSAIMLIITCVVAAVGIYSNHKSKQSLDDMYNYNLMTTQYLNDANNQLRAIISHVSYIQQQNFTVENRKVVLEDISNKLKILQDDVAKVKEINRSQRSQATIAELEKNLADFSAKAKRNAVDRIPDLGFAIGDSVVDRERHVFVFHGNRAIQL